MTNQINRFKGHNAWLSNFYPVIIKIDTFNYSSVEHAFQAHKSDSIAWKIFCSNYHNSAGLVKQMGRKQILIPTWEEDKVAIMEKCLRIKFNNSYFRNLLLNTGDMDLIEGNYHYDTFWGVDLKQSPPVGENILGRLLMHIREEIRNP